MTFQLSKSKSLFSENELRLLREKTLPEHIAIIMDGNRRWAKANKFSTLKSTFEGHNAGALNLATIVQASIEIGIKALTIYGFSTENRTRSSREIEILYQVIEFSLKKNKEKMIDEGVKFNFMGDLSPFPASLIKVIEDVKKATEKGSCIEVVIGLNYGSRNEITRAFKRLLNEVEKGHLKKDEISEKTISSFLDTAHLKDPDLLIRTSGEMRLSNFLLWQLAYTEIYVTECLWPDFDHHHFLRALFEFQKRERRIGK